MTYLIKYVETLQSCLKKTGRQKRKRFSMCRIRNDVSLLFVSDSIRGAINIIYNYIYRLDCRLSIDGKIFSISSILRMGENYVLLPEVMKPGNRWEFESILYDFIINRWFAGNGAASNIVFDVLSSNGKTCGSCVIEYENQDLILVKLSMNSEFIHMTKSDYNCDGFDGELLVASIKITCEGQSFSDFKKRVEHYLGNTIQYFTKQNIEKDKLAFYQRHVQRWIQSGDWSPVNFNLRGKSLIYFDPNRYGYIELLAHDDCAYSVDIALEERRNFVRNTNSYVDLIAIS